MSVYDFNEQNMRGERGEAFLDAFFEERGNVVHHASRTQQRRGIDRVFVRGEQRARVEYKTDFLAHDTGHIFIETISVDTEGRAGWAVTSHADLLVYFVPGAKLIYVIRLERVRELLPGWAEQYPTRPAQNKEYATHGILVPVNEFVRHVTQALSVDG